MPGSRERYPEDFLAEAREGGYTFATPIEKSGQDEFDFDKGDPGYKEQLKRIQPTFCKVLVRYNPAGDAVMNKRQAARLLHLSRTTLIDKLQRLNTTAAA